MTDTNVSILTFLIFIVSLILINNLKYETVKETKNEGKAIVTLDRDCIKKKMPCQNNSDCLRICNQPSFICNQNICKKLPKIRQFDDDELNCNNKHGIFIVAEHLPGGGLFRRCMSFYKELWTNDDKMAPGVCRGGVLDTNVMDHPPRLEDCKCPPGQTAITLNANSRPILQHVIVPKCIPIHNKHFYKS